MPLPPPWFPFALIALAACLGGTAEARANGIAVKGARVGLHADRTRLVLELARSSEFRVRTPAADQVAIELPAATGPLPPALAGVGLIRRVSFQSRPGGGIEALVTVKGPARIDPGFILPASDGRPVRLVFDLRPQGESGTLRSAELQPLQPPVALPLLDEPSPWSGGVPPRLVPSLPPAKPSPAAGTLEGAPGGVRIDAVVLDTQARLDLTWPGPVAVEHLFEDRSLTLFFSQPFGNAPLGALPERLPGWVDTVLYGYDSVLLTLAPGVVPVVTPSPLGVSVTLDHGIDHQAAARPAFRAADTASEARITYFRAVVLQAAGQLIQARTLLSAQLDADPGNVQTAMLLAQLEEQLGRWQRAVALYDRVLQLSPDDPAAIRAKAALLHQHGDSVRLDHDRRVVGKEDTQLITQLTGRMTVHPQLSLGYVFEDRRIRADSVARADGTVSAFSGNRQQAQLSASFEALPLQQTKASLYLQEANAGAGLSQRIPDGDGATEIGLAWRQPEVSLIQAVVDRGRRSRIYALREQRLGEDWSAAAGLGLNRYAVGSADDVADSSALNGSLRYTLNPAFPTVSVGYIFDGEYLFNGRAERSDGLGNLSPLLAINPREVHAGEVAIEDQITDYFRYALIGGWAHNRLNTGGPYVTASLGYEPLGGLEMGLRVSHAQSTTRNDSEIESYGGYLIFRH